MANNQNRASWKDSTTTLFLRLLVEEKNSGNWSGKSATKKGYENVGNTISRQTGTNFNRTQLKSKFDGLRQVFHLWTNMFNGQTGAGYEHATGRVIMSEAWWETKIRENETYKKFKKNGLENAELMYSVFGDNSATGMYQYTPTAFRPNTGLDNVVDESSRGDISPTPTPRLDEDVNSPPRNVEGSGSGSGSRLSGGKRKVRSDDAWQSTLESLTNAVNSTKEYVHRHVHTQVDEDTDLTNKAFDMLYSMPEVTPGSKLFFTAVSLLKNKDDRNVFLNIRNPEHRLMWLQMNDK